MSEDIFQDIALAIDRWLDDITILEERTFKIQTLRERIHRTITQVQFEGETSAMDLARLNHVGDMWIKSLEALNEGQKRTIIVTLLKLFDYGEMSLDLLTEIILKL